MDDIKEKISECQQEKESIVNTLLSLGFVETTGNTSDITRIFINKKTRLTVWSRYDKLFLFLAYRKVEPCDIVNHIYIAATNNHTMYKYHVTNDDIMNCITSVSDFENPGSIIAYFSNMEVGQAIDALPFREAVYV